MPDRAEGGHLRSRTNHAGNLSTSYATSISMAYEKIIDFSITYPLPGTSKPQRKLILPRGCRGLRKAW